MRAVRLGLARTLNFSSRFQQPLSLRTLSTNALLEADEKDEKPPNNLSEFTGDIKRTISGPSSLGKNQRGNAFRERVDDIGKYLDGLGSNRARPSREKNRSDEADGLDQTFESLRDNGPAGKLEKASMAFGDFYEGDEPGHSSGALSKNNRRIQRRDSEVTTAEALNKADFRNTRFLAKFITESGIIVKRRQTGISAKAQRKIAREIKTARSFGLLPFTTQGTKSFAFGRPMQDFADEFEFDNFRGPVSNEMSMPMTDFVVRDPINTDEIR